MDVNIKSVFPINTLQSNAHKVLVLRDVPLTLMTYVSGKYEPMYVAYNVYCLDDRKYFIQLSRGVKFKKELFTQLLQQVIIDVFGRRKYLPGSDVKFLEEVSSVFRNKERNIFKLVPSWAAKNKAFVLNSRLLSLELGSYNYFACNFIATPKDPRKRVSFLLWRE